MIPDSLRTAYLQALYCFGEASWAIELKPEQPSGQLERWMQENGVRCVAVLTAFNPGSRPCSITFNLEAQKRLIAQVAARGLPYLEGRNLDPAGKWPPEDSLLIGNLALGQARDLASQFGQLAFLWSDGSAVPQLCDTGSG